MYKREIFENMETLLDFLNTNKVSERCIIAILPFQTTINTGEAQLKREYELIYKEQNKSTLI